MARRFYLVYLRFYSKAFVPVANIMAGRKLRLREEVRKNVTTKLRLGHLIGRAIGSFSKLILLLGVDVDGTVSGAEHLSRHTTFHVIRTFCGGLVKVD